MADQVPDKATPASSSDAAATVPAEAKDPAVLEAERKARRAAKEAAKKEKAAAKAAKAKEKEAGAQKVTKLGMSIKKADNFGDWYSEVVVKAELIDYYPISGCYILRPWSFNMWDRIRNYMDGCFAPLGVQNCYFPLFIPKRALELEKDHVEGFAPEVAWVTKSGNSDLEEHIAIRPTSETVMYPSYAKWIRSHRDLPLKLNQWSNIVRWEFKNPTPFIRSREFLWQEGHTAFETKEESDAEVLQILDIYEKVYSDLMAVPVIKGKKTEEEKFPGGLYTTTVEGFIPGTGRGIQGATSHSLGQNFAKMFEIKYEAREAGAPHQMPWQNSWGFTTRSIGVMIMTHSDDTGLVLPPRIAPTQVVVIPIPKGGADPTPLQTMAKDVVAALQAAGVRVHLDDSTHRTPGWKYSHWEMKGVPLRIEIGARDLESKSVMTVRRDLLKQPGAKASLPAADLATSVPALLETIHQDMLARATAERDAHTAHCFDWTSFMAEVNAKKMALSPWCEEQACELKVKARSSEESDRGAIKSLCVPFKQPDLAADAVCFHCSKQAKVWCLWGRSY